MRILPQGISFVVRLTHTPANEQEGQRPIIRDTEAIYLNNELMFGVDFPELGIQEKVVYRFQDLPAVWPMEGSAVFYRINFISLVPKSYLVNGTLAYLNNVQQLTFIDVTGIWKRQLHPDTQPITLPVK